MVHKDQSGVSEKQTNKKTLLTLKKMTKLTVVSRLKQGLIFELMYAGIFECV